MIGVLSLLWMCKSFCWSCSMLQEDASPLHPEKLGALVGFVFFHHRDAWLKGFNGGVLTMFPVALRNIEGQSPHSRGPIPGAYSIHLRTVYA